MEQLTQSNPAPAPAPESRLHFLDYWRVIRIRKAIIITVFLITAIIATAGQLRELRLSFPSTCVFVGTMLERISGAVAAAGSGLKSVSIEVNAVPPNVEQQIYHQYLTFAIAPVAARHVSILVTVAAY